MDEATANLLLRELHDEGGRLTMDVGPKRAPMELRDTAVRCRECFAKKDCGIELEDPGGHRFVIWEAAAFEAAQKDGYRFLRSLSWRNALRGLVWVVVFPEVLIVPLGAAALIVIFVASGLSALTGDAGSGQRLDFARDALVIAVVLGVLAWLSSLAWKSAKPKRLLWLKTGAT